MKNFKSYFIVLGVLSFILVSACKDNKDDPQPSTPFAYSQEKLEKRWNVSNSNRTSGVAGSTLIAIEFVGNAYVLYFPNDSIVAGTYTTSGADVLILDTFGKLKINALSDTNFGFELEVNGTKEIITSAKATQTIADSDFTTKLCRTWKLIEISYNGITEHPEAEVTFNKYGTYLTKNTELGYTEIGTNTWMWSNTTGDDICYGEWDGGNITDCNGLGHVSIAFSADGKLLTMVEPDDIFGDTTYKLELK